MGITEFYDAIGGDLPGVRGRLKDDERIEKYLRFFMEDPTFQSLQDSLAASDDESAFRAAHSMKGLCSNLGFTELLDASSDLTEALRLSSDGKPAAPQDVPALMNRVEAAYGAVAGAMELLG